MAALGHELSLHVCSNAAVSAKCILTLNTINLCHNCIIKINDDKKYCFMHSSLILTQSSLTQYIACCMTATKGEIGEILLSRLTKTLHISP